MKKNAKTKKATLMVEDKPPAGPSDITVVYSRNEALSLAQLLVFSKNVCAEMAINLLKEGKDKDAEVFNARSVLSDHLLGRLKVIEQIGEPESRQVH